MSGLKRALRIIACLWIISLFSAMPFAVFTSVHYVDFPPGRQFHYLFPVVNLFLITVFFFFQMNIILVFSHANDKQLKKCDDLLCLILALCRPLYNNIIYIRPFLLLKIFSTFCVLPFERKRREKDR